MVDTILYNVVLMDVSIYARQFVRKNHGRLTTFLCAGSASYPWTLCAIEI